MINYRFFLLVTYALFPSIYTFTIAVRRFCLPAAHSPSISPTLLARSRRMGPSCARPADLRQFCALWVGTETGTVREDQGVCAGAAPSSVPSVTLPHVRLMHLKHSDLGGGRSCCINQTTLADFPHLCLKVNFPLFRDFRDQHSAFSPRRNTLVSSPLFTSHANKLNPSSSSSSVSEDKRSVSPSSHHAYS